MNIVYKLIICIIIITPYIAISKQKIILTALNDFAPYLYKDSLNKPIGLYIDIINTVFKNMPNYEVAIQLYPWKRALLLVEKGTAFGVIPPFIRSNRHYLSPYSDPLFTETSIVICNKKANIKGRKDWPKDFAGMTIGNKLGFVTAGTKFFDMVTSGKIKNKEFSNINIALKLLKLGRIDCYVNDRLVINYSMNILNYDRSNFVEALVIKQETSHIGFSAKINGSLKDKFVADFNLQLKKIKENGQYQEILKKYSITN